GISVSSGTDVAYALLIQPDGKIVVGGYGNPGLWQNFAIARLNADGSTDSTFGSGGQVVMAVGSANNVIESLSLQDDGKIIAAGLASSADPDFAIVRYNANGSLDTSFANGGVLQQSLGYIDDASAVKALSTGKIIVAGSSYPTSHDPNNAAVICLN